MPNSGRLYRGQLIGAVALAFLFWALPLVLYALFAQLNPDNLDAKLLASRWAAKDQSLVLGIFALIAALALWFDSRQSRRAESQWTLRRAIRFAVLIAAFQWIVPLATSEHGEFWAVRTAELSLNLFGLIVLTRLVAQEVEKLEGRRAIEKVEGRAVTA